MEITSLLCTRVGDTTILYSCSVDGSIALCEVSDCGATRRCHTLA